MLANQFTLMTNENYHCAFHKCPLLSVRSLCSAYGKTSLTPCITDSPQSMQNVKPSGVPLASFNLFINHCLFSFVSESITLTSLGIIQLCPSVAQAMHNFPLNFLVQNVLCTPKQGLQPLRKPSTQGSHQSLSKDYDA
jgi:hypothetical protein